MHFETASRYVFSTFSAMVIQDILLNYRWPRFAILFETVVRYISSVLSENAKDIIKVLALLDTVFYQRHIKAHAKYAASGVLNYG